MCFVFSLIAARNLLQTLRLAGKPKCAMYMSQNHAPRVLRVPGCEGPIRCEAKTNGHQVKEHADIQDCDACNANNSNLFII